MSKTLFFVSFVIVFFVWCKNSNNEQSLHQELTHKKTCAENFFNEATSTVEKIGKPFTIEDSLGLKNAILLLDSAIVIDKNNEKYINKRIRIKCYLGYYNDALSDISCQIKLNNSGGNHIVKGFIYDKAGKVDSALYEYKNAICIYNLKINSEKINSDEFINLKLKKILTLCLLGDYKKANKEIDELYQENPSNQNVIFARKNIVRNFNKNNFIDDNL